MLVVVAGGGAGVGYAVTRSPGPAHPARWDPRVQPLADVVERQRGLRFEHPVFVDFLPDDQFTRKVTSDTAKVTRKERQQADAFAAVFRALGLVEGKVDLLKDVNTLNGEGVLAFYDPKEQRVFVRGGGTELTVGLRVTLVHELTHALQDQRFGLSRLDDTSSDQASTAFRTLVEGDARRVEQAYVGTLSEQDRQAYNAQTRQETRQAESAVDQVPPVLVVLFGAPYDLGDGLMAVLGAQGGNAAVDAAFRDPPVSDEQVLDPWKYLARDRPKDVPVPKLERGEQRVEEGDFGALGWYLMLAARLDPRRALDALDGWGGDAYLAYRTGGRVCVRVAYRGDTARDTDAMAAVLRDWVAAMPPGSASLSRSGDRLLLRSCDPGTDTPATGTGNARASMILPLLRTGLSAQLVREGVPEAPARCVAARVVGTFAPAELPGLESTVENDQAPAGIEQRVLEGARACGVPVPGG